MPDVDLLEYQQWQTPVVDADLQSVTEEKARIYVKDPSKAPPGVQLTKGPRGGMYFDSNSVPKMNPYKGKKLPTKPKPKAAPKGKKPKEEKPKEEERPKREFGQQMRDAEDLPSNVQMESKEVQDEYIKVFNEVLNKGGSEADARAYAKEVLPKHGPEKPETKKPEKRAVGQPFNSFDDPSIPLKVRQENEQVKRDWVLTFNVELKKGGSEADAIAAANEKLPDRKKPKPVKAPRASLPKTEESKKTFSLEVWSKAWSEANQLRDPKGRFDGTTGAGSSGGGSAGAAFDVATAAASMADNPAWQDFNESYFGSMKAFSINTALRGTGSQHWDMSGPAQRLLSKADAASVTLPHDVPVQRAIFFKGKVPDTFRKGAIITDKGFTSTTTSKEWAKYHKERTKNRVGVTVMMNIKLPKGTKVIPHAKESELVITPPSRYRITGKSFFGNTYNAELIND